MQSKDDRKDKRFFLFDKSGNRYQIRRSKADENGKMVSSLVTDKFNGIIINPNSPESRQISLYRVKIDVPNDRPIFYSNPK